MSWDEPWRTFLKAPLGRDKEVHLLFMGEVCRSDFDIFMEMARICRDVLPERPDWCEYGLPADPRTGAA